jgi:hypothetical protein
MSVKDKIRARFTRSAYALVPRGSTQLLQSGVIVPNPRKSFRP